MSRAKVFSAVFFREEVASHKGWTEPIVEQIHPSLSASSRAIKESWFLPKSRAETHHHCTPHYNFNAEASSPVRSAESLFHRNAFL